MPIPKECKMPDLSNLDSPLINRLIVKLLIGEKNLNPNVAKYRRIFIRLIDRAIRHYIETRTELVSLIKASEKSLDQDRYLHFSLISFPDHMEIIINSLSRLNKLLSAISGEKIKSPEIPRLLRRSVLSEESAIRSIRGCIEHIENDIRQGKIVSGTPVMLSMDKDWGGIILSELRLSFIDLSLILRNMNEIALYLLEIKNTSRTKRT